VSGISFLSAPIAA
jgi:hypothetical protein